MGAFLAPNAVKLGEQQAVCAKWPAKHCCHRRAAPPRLRPLALRHAARNVDSCEVDHSAIREVVSLGRAGRQLPPPPSGWPGAAAELKQAPIWAPAEKGGDEQNEARAAQLSPGALYVLGCL